MTTQIGRWRQRPRRLGAWLSVIVALVTAFSAPATAQVRGTLPIFPNLPPAPFGNVPGILISWEYTVCPSIMNMTVTTSSGHTYTTTWKRTTATGVLTATFVPQSGSTILSDNKRYRLVGASITVQCIDLQYKAFLAAIDSWIVLGENVIDNTGTEQPVAPPKAKPSLDADGSYGSNVSANIPSGSDLLVGFDGSGSSSDDPGIALVAYLWTAGGSTISSSASGSYMVSGSTGFGLTVTDELGQTGSAGASVSVSFFCNDPAADNYLDSGDCTYAPEICEDPSADNYGEPGDCEYPPPPPDICTDPGADNYGGPPPCEYPPPPTTCDDPSADNYGAVGDCTYGNPAGPPDPDPGTDPGGGGSPDDPCAYEIWDDPFCDDGGGIYEESLRPGRHRAPGLHVLGVKRNLAKADPNAYYVVLVDRWRDPSVTAMVGRFPHAHGYVDAIYLPSSKPTVEGFTLAVRALSQDRVRKFADTKARRVVRIKADGTQLFTRQDGKQVALEKLAPIPKNALGKMNGDFQSGVMSKIRKAPKKSSKHMQAVQLIKWPRQ